MIFFTNLSNVKTCTAFAQLIYAIATADGKFNHTELSITDEKINGFNLAKEIKEKLILEISELRIQGSDTEKSFEYFIEFKTKNENLFDKESKQLIWEICEQIASANSGKNKSELLMLSRLASVLSN